MDDGSEKKKAKGTRKCVIKHRLMFENYKDCLFNNTATLISQQRFKAIMMRSTQKKPIRLN